MIVNKTVLSADLSLACPAFAVVEVTADSTKETVTILHLSHVKTKASKGLGYRLDEIAKHLQSIFNQYDIDEVVVEKGFSRFHTATHQIQRVVGVFVYTVFKNGIFSFDEMTPTTVKKAITGDGKAKKDKVAEMLSKYFPNQTYKNDDESDAVAVAIAYMKKEGWLL